MQRLDRLLQLRLRSVELRVSCVKRRLCVLESCLALPLFQRERVAGSAQTLELVRA